ncbi:hypothetical protein IW261DRAFT_1442797 [Armillaria novae-zelandiae]|uniref:SUZ domain-containing protein n=1 Tax=Armillaria novae-zelandiae TaxID=153914 RepID=A0AA39PR90_9AGAR|nr:hypothetical protein IW261DRAFT_1442797 [Armillaria novae-zelandiae]
MATEQNIPQSRSDSSISSLSSSRASSSSPVSTTMSDANPTTSFAANFDGNDAAESAPDSIHSFTEGANPNVPSSLPAGVQSFDGDQPVVADAISQSPSPDIDPQILEALRSKDRIYVLKLGELMEGLITERRARIDVMPSTSYQRLLVYRCSTYYKLVPESDPATKGLFVSATPESRIPPRRLADLVPPEFTASPAFQIMRRNQQDRRQKPHSQAGSVNGEDADLSDAEPSEAGSLGGRSNATGGSGKKRMTIEEREAAYNEARSRIFMDFQEKEKDTSASSSSLSVVSGSASTSGGSIADFEDSASSLATESEWSAPSVSRDKKRSGNSNRSLRGSATPFSSNGAGSSRNSRASSPSSFTYASLYEPAAPGPSYDGSQHPGPVSMPAYQATSYFYPYAPPGQPPNPTYVAAPYPYYNPFSYGPPVQQNAPDPSSGSSHEVYSPTPHVPYHNQYVWASPHPPPGPVPIPVPQGSPPAEGPVMVNGPHQNPQAQNPPSFQGYSPQVYMYPMPGYYTPQPGQHMAMAPPPPPMIGQVFDPRVSAEGSFGDPDMNRHANHNSRGGYSNGLRSDRNDNGHFNGGGRGRNAPQPRHAWSFGPGISGYNGNAPAGLNEIGPRFNNTRRQSNHSNGSSGNYRSSNWDEVSSTASSSTTSSSSRRTYTSTSSQQQHPLPARPDWAVGLKPDLTLHATHNRHHDHSSNNSRNMSPVSPPRNLNGGSHQGISPRRPPSNQSVPLHSNDFPPLSSLSPTEKRAPVVAGAWTNSSSTRSLLINPGQGNALVHHPSNGNSPVAQQSRLEDSDRMFERPPPRATELFNPKVVKRPTSTHTNGKQDKESDGRRIRDPISGSNIVEQVRTMALEDYNLDGSGQTSKEPSALAMPT